MDETQAYREPTADDGDILIVDQKTLDNLAVVRACADAKQAHAELRDLPFGRYAILRVARRRIEVKAPEQRKAVVDLGESTVHRTRK